VLDVRREFRFAHARLPPIVMPSFSLSRLLVSMMAIATGVGLMVTVFRPLPYEEAFSEVALMAMWLCGYSFFGFGLLNLVKHPIIGAVVGFLVALVLMLLFIWMLSAATGGFGGWIMLIQAPTHKSPTAQLLMAVDIFLPHPSAPCLPFGPHT
jgi:hypothetical protein